MDPSLSVSNVREVRQETITKQRGTVSQPPDLAFTQDAVGRYLSFYWCEAESRGLSPQQVVNQVMTPQCGPVNLERYLGKVRRVLDHLRVERFRQTFCYADQLFDFELTLSPTLEPDQLTRVLLVMGRRVQIPTPAPVRNPTKLQCRWGRDLAAFDRLCTQIAWNIRRTLNLDVIWQQTATGLGSALQANHCLICPYEPGALTVSVVAEYHARLGPSLQGHTLTLRDHPVIQQTLHTLIPQFMAAQVESDHGNLVIDPVATLVIATSYQDQPNGLIILSQCIDGRFLNVPQSKSLANEHTAAHEGLSELEQDVFRELGDQVGTAIAHAKLFAQRCQLAQELQRLNDDLVQKQQEFEEARRQAEEASRLKSEFLANTSHELRTPLNGMIGFLKLVLDKLADTPEEEQEFLEEAHRSALLLLDIINDILDVAKIEAGKMELELTSVSLNDLLKDVERKIRPQTSRRGLTFQIQAPATRDEVLVYADYQRLLQIMMNLAGNAIKFTPEGAVTISTKIVKQKIQCHGQELPGYVKIRVADTGIGVALEKQAKLFRAFSQIDSSRTRQYGGTGLGLVISQKLAEAMGGSVEFYSMGEGLGATVTCTVLLYQEPVMMTTDL